MHCRRFLVGLIVTLASTAVAGAQVAKEVTLFGQKYSLTSQSLGGAYKNGLSVALAPDDNKSAEIRFVPGETPEKDRLFVGTAYTGDDTFRVDSFYLLTGADASGVFSQANSNLTQFFGGAAGDFNRNGRVSTVTFLSDTDTGVKKDRNLALSTFSGDDYLRFYDLDTLTGDYIGDAVQSVVQRCINADEGDPGMPACGFIMGVPQANGSVLFLGRGEGEGPQLGVMDPATGKFFNALTQLGTLTESQTTPFDIATDPQDMELISGNEYWILGSNPGGLGLERISQEIYRARLTLPADLTKAEPNSIKAEIVGKQVILNTDESIDQMGVGPRGIVGMAVGRAVNGVPRLYFTTGTGILITANPAP